MTAMLSAIVQVKKFVNETINIKIYFKEVGF